MELGTTLRVTQKQQLRLSPQLLQSFELMALPLTELQQRIKTEIETNPALELPSTWDLSWERFSNQRASTLREDSYSDSSSYGSDRGGYDYEASDRQRRFIENALTRQESLQEHLLSQLGCEHLSDAEYAVGQILITALDANGFFTQEPSTLLKGEQGEHLEAVLAVIRRFDPVGVGALSWRHSLILQAADRGLEGKQLATFSALVYDNLELMRSNKTAQVAKNLSIEEDELDELYTLLKSLTPFPGQGFASGPQQFVIPELSIRRQNGELVLATNDAALPDLRIQASFKEMADDLAEGREAKEATRYINEQIKRAESLIFQLEIRNRTLYRLAQILMREQRDFFLYGPLYIKPLTQKEVAQQLEVHETTVSRISTAKWIDTDWGLIQVKGLFSSGVGEEGAQRSKEAVKEMIKLILDEHRGQKALSDQKIADLLNEEGITIARRTVAKYRNELNIDPSFVRGTN
jgi:RNA polymerase sigma-54 factor